MTPIEIKKRTKIFQLLAGPLAVVVMLICFPEEEAYSKDDVRVDLMLKDVSVEQALIELGKILGEPIELIGEGGRHRSISIRLDNANLSESIHRILRPLNYTVIWVAGGGISILVKQSGLVYAPSPSVANGVAHGISTSSADWRDDRGELVPGDESEDDPVYSDNLEYIAQTGTVWSSWDEILPLDDDELYGPTVEDNYKTSLEFSRATEPENIEILPPVEEGAIGVTLAEILSGSEGAYVLEDRARDEILPPDLEAGYGVTRAELDRMDSESSLSPGKSSVSSELESLPQE